MLQEAGVYKKLVNYECAEISAFPARLTIINFSFEDIQLMREDILLIACQRSVYPTIHHLRASSEGVDKDIQASTLNSAC